MGETQKLRTACSRLTGRVRLRKSIVGMGIVGASFIGPNLAAIGITGIHLNGIGGGARAIAFEISSATSPKTSIEVPTTVSQWNPPSDNIDNRVNDIDSGLESEDVTVEELSPSPSPGGDDVNGVTLEQTDSPLSPPQNPNLPDLNRPLHHGNPPQQLVEVLRQIDTAASNEDLDTVMAFYSPNLQHSDGLTYQDLETMLAAFWENHNALTYSTQITEWQQTEAGFMTTTVTTVTGQQTLGTAVVAFEATIESKQQMNDQVIVDQEIVAEQSRISLGEQPPTVRVSLPDQVAIGQPFYFDAIVLEPIGNSLLMGTAFSDTVSLANYTLIPALELDVLGAGGLFKVGDAPATPSNEWVSGLVIREDGMTGVTQRLQIVNLSEL
ncbi:MAG: hypothetical protein F6K09_04400 [Merismopedia sp. SIO2A8]|nr:hypothetical protein [Merismopedia sp. SIO2A8]